MAVVALPVFVTDKQGQPVGGLTAADFEVTDEGKPVTVVAVQEIDVVSAAPVPAEAPASLQAAARRQFLASRGNPTPEMPVRVGTDLFTPQGLPRLANGRADSVCVLAFSPTPFGAKSSLPISAHLTDHSGTRVPLGAPLALAKPVAETDGFRRFVLKVTPTGVPPGDYNFRVRIKDPLSAEPAESAQAVRIN